MIYCESIVTYKKCAGPSISLLSQNASTISPLGLFTKQHKPHKLQKPHQNRP